MHIGNDAWSRRHDAESEPSAIADDDRSRYRIGKRDGDMPQRSRGESAGGESAGRQPFRVKRLDLHAHVDAVRIQTGVPERVPDLVPERRFLGDAIAATSGWTPSP